MKRLNMRNNTNDGILITFCGLDGSGKSTLIKMLVEDLSKEYDVYITKQPTDFVRSSEIFRTYMDSPDHDAYDYRSLSLLAASDRVQHVNKQIEPELMKRKIVISDRYFYSCLANLRARGYKNDKWIYEIARSVIKPNIAFFIDSSVETAVGRVRQREEEKDRYIDMNLQYELRDEYINICKKNNGVLVSSEIPIEESYTLIKDCVRKELENYERSERCN